MRCVFKLNVIHQFRHVKHVLAVAVKGTSSSSLKYSICSLVFVCCLQAYMDSHYSTQLLLSNFG